MVLHANELGPSMLLCCELQCREFYRPHTTRADISNLSTFHKIMQRLHCLFNGDILVEAVDLQEVDVVDLKSLQAPFDRFEDMLRIS